MSFIIFYIEDHFAMKTIGCCKTPPRNKNKFGGIRVSLPITETKNVVNDNVTNLFLQHMSCTKWSSLRLIYVGISTHKLCLLAPLRCFYHKDPFSWKNWEFIIWKFQNLVTVKVIVWAQLLFVTSFFSPMS